MKVRARFEGRAAVYRRLNRLLPNTEQELAEAQMEAGRELAGKIVGRAPRQTGEYQASIQADKIASRGGQTPVGTGGTKDPNAVGIFANYIWRFLEFGTVKMSAQPHIFPTYRQEKKRIRRKMANAVNKAVRKARG